MTPTIHDQPLPYIDRLPERDAGAVDTVVIHCTELPDLATAREYGERPLHDNGTGNCGHYYVDRDGGIWIACWGGGCVSRFTPNGVRERSIALPASQISNCVFAGADLDRMYVTSAADGVDEPHAGALFEIDPGCRGVPAHRYAG